MELGDFAAIRGAWRSQDVPDATWNGGIMVSIDFDSTITVSIMSEWALDTMMAHTRR